MVARIPAGLVAILAAVLVGDDPAPASSSFAMPMIEVRDESLAAGAVVAFEEAPTLPACEGWPRELGSREAMQTCSMHADLEVNERWYFWTRAEVVDGRATELAFVTIERTCTHCFPEGADDRHQRAWNTLRDVRACIRTQIAAARFAPQAARCAFEMGWSIKSDW